MHPHTFDNIRLTPAKTFSRYLFSAIIFAAALLCSAESRAGSITLSWDASAEPVTGYTVYYGTQSVIANPSAAASASAGKNLQSTVSGLTSGTTYYFAVKAYNSYGASGFSNQVSAVVPAVTTTTTSLRPTTTTTSVFIDTDKDGIADKYDNCPTVYNPRQLDGDTDGIGDVCDTTPGCGGCGQPDCEKYASAAQKSSLILSADADQDGIGDAADNCPDVYNPLQLDANNNTKGDCCDPAPECGHTGEPDCDAECAPQAPF